MSIAQDFSSGNKNNESLLPLGEGQGEGSPDRAKFFFSLRASKLVLKIKGYKIMQKFSGMACVWLALFMAAGFRISDADEPLRPIVAYEIPSPTWHVQPPYIGHPAIYKLQAGESALQIMMLAFFSTGWGTADTLIDYYGIWKYNLETHDIFNLINDDKMTDFRYGDPTQINLARDRVHTIDLEDSHYHLIEGSFHQTAEITLPTLSFNGKFVGAFLQEYSYTEDDIIGRNFINKFVGLWDATSGKRLQFIWIPFFQSEAPCEIEIRFSPSDRFLIARYAVNHEATGRIPDWHYEHLCYLLNTNTLELWPAHGDVAFTSDERWLATERDGIPTLVDTETGANLQRYDIGETNILTAACFSPDDQKLYIAGIDRKIYVFDSHLSSLAAGWEVYP